MDDFLLGLLIVTGILTVGVGILAFVIAKILGPMD